MNRAVVVMGVSGCGKTSVAQTLAANRGWRAVDADELHAPDAVAKMRAGQPLTDAGRWPWLDRVGAVLAAATAHGEGVLVACSALPRAYRDRLRAACPGLRFIFLDGSRELIAARMVQRRHHYMPASLLDSQLQTLERPGADESDVLSLQIDRPLDNLIHEAGLALRYGATGAAAHLGSPAHECTLSRIGISVSRLPRRRGRRGHHGHGHCPPPAGARP